MEEMKERKERFRELSTSSDVIAGCVGPRSSYASDGDFDAAVVAASRKMDRKIRATRILYKDFKRYLGDFLVRDAPDQVHNKHCDTCRDKAFAVKFGGQNTGTLTTVCFIVSMRVTNRDRSKLSSGFRQPAGSPAAAPVERSP